MRILVVEDDPRLLRNLAKVFREKGYAVDTAEAGDEGLYKAESYSYDAIILDVMLPRLDGWEVLERLRTNQRTPVLMLTARDLMTTRRGAIAQPDREVNLLLGTASKPTRPAPAHPEGAVWDSPFAKQSWKRTAAGSRPRARWERARPLPCAFPRNSPKPIEIGCD